MPDTPWVAIPAEDGEGWNVIREGKPGGERYWFRREEDAKEAADYFNQGDGYEFSDPRKG